MKKILILLLLVISLLDAKNSLAEKISKLQSVPKSQRYKLVNEIKKELATLNRKQRIKAIKKMRIALDAKSAKKESIKSKNIKKNVSVVAKVSPINNIKTPVVLNTPTAPQIPNLPATPNVPNIPVKVHIPIKIPIPNIQNIHIPLKIPKPHIPHIPLLRK